MYYTKEELQEIGFERVGHDVLISKSASIYGAARISIGDHVRIDDFCVISTGVEGRIIFGSYIHIAVFCSIIGNGEIRMDDFSGLSSRVSIYSSSDNYSGDFMTNPTVPKEFTNVQSGLVHLKKHVVIGAGSVLLPGVILGEGVAIGALSLVNRSIDDFMIAAGNPAKPIKKRSMKLKEAEQKLMNQTVS
jgi:galactoside O-acetyltransferase